MKRIDIIIPYIMGPNNGLELKFALRSIQKNFQHDNFRLIVVGDRPDWLTGVEHLPFTRVGEQKNRSFTDQLLKLYSALTQLDISPNFIWTYDDVYFTRPIKLVDLKQLKSIANLDKYPNHLLDSGAGTNWKNTMKYTLDSVIKNGGSNYNYETHLPRFFNAKKALDLIDKFNLLGKPMMISTLYYNYYHKNETPLCLFDSNPGIRFLLRTTIELKRLRKELSKHLFMNNAPGSWNIITRKVLMELFPSKSEFEL